LRKQIATALKGRADSAASSVAAAATGSRTVATLPSASMRSSISITSRRSTTAAGF